MVIFLSQGTERSGLSSIDETLFGVPIHDDSAAYGYIAGEALDTLCSEDEAYEYFCNIADNSIGTYITAIACFDGSARGREESNQLFRSRIRAIYRASVWGQFSLLCTGISTPNELSECTDILKETFCELESEGREFNGFIEKGICIDTPMLLYNLPQRSRFDFLCFDFERLRYLCTGIEDSDLGENELAEYIVNICSSNEKCETAIKAYTKESAEKIIKALYPLKIKKIYFPRQHG